MLSVDSCPTLLNSSGHLPEKTAETVPWHTLCIDLIGPCTIGKIKHKTVKGKHIEDLDTWGRMNELADKLAKEHWSNTQFQSHQKNIPMTPFALCYNHEWLRNYKINEIYMHHATFLVFLEHTLQDWDSSTCIGDIIFSNVSGLSQAKVIKPPLEVWI